jgi:hypothetical protein
MLHSGEKNSQSVTKKINILTHVVRKKMLIEKINHIVT